MEVRINELNIINDMKFDEHLGLVYGLRLIISQSLYGYRWWIRNRRQEQEQTISTEPMTI